MRKVFTFIISGLVFSQLSAQQLSPSASIGSTPGYSQEPGAKSNNLSGIENAGEIPLARLYPNPADDQIHIRFNEKMIGNSVRIYSLLGSEVVSHSIGGAQETIDVSILPSGLYIYSIIDKNNKTVVSGKFNKQ
ncbi:MAG: hypothetical protein JWO03_3890 [Bacteroidetes bacterium]|nr:hypothetical protein [Bacteroidota bacterium]